MSEMSELEKARAGRALGLELAEAATAAHRETLAELHAAQAQLNELINALADCVVKATEYGEQDGGFVANYISPTGPIHRAIPLLERLGITVRPGFDGRAEVPR